MIVDLTDTQRYYDPAEVIAKNVIHKKVAVNFMSRDGVPMEKLAQLLEDIKQFREENPNKIVVIHWLVQFVSILLERTFK